MVYREAAEMPEKPVVKEPSIIWALLQLFVIPILPILWVCKFFYEHSLAIRRVFVIIVSILIGAALPLTILNTIIYFLLPNAFIIILFISIIIYIIILGVALLNDDASLWREYREKSVEIISNYFETGKFTKNDF